MTNKEEMKKIYEKGFNAEVNQRGCSQCILIALKEKYDVPNDVFKSACGLGGGVGLTGEGTCGAFLGGAMVIGYLFGRGFEEVDNILKLRTVSEYVRRYKQKFMDEYGSFNCADIQKKLMGKGGFKLYKPEELELFDKLGGHTDKCPDVVGKAANWAIEIIDNIEKEMKK